MKLSGSMTCVSMLFLVKTVLSQAKIAQRPRPSRKCPAGLSETQRLETMAAQNPVQVNLEAKVEAYQATSAQPLNLGLVAVLHKRGLRSEISAVDATTMPAITKKRLAQAPASQRKPTSQQHAAFC